MVTHKHVFTVPARQPVSSVGGYCRDMTWKQFGDFCYFLELEVS